MEFHKILGISIIGGLWFLGVCSYIYACIKTRTWPFEVPDCELFDRAFKTKDENEQENSTHEKGRG